jgi:hypothetical protein
MGCPLVVFIDEFEIRNLPVSFIRTRVAKSRPIFPLGRSYRVSFFPSKSICAFASQNPGSVAASVAIAMAGRVNAPVPSSEPHVPPLNRPPFQRCLANGRRRERGRAHSVEAVSCSALDRARKDPHPDLYDRMLAAGVKPDYPRPDKPKTTTWVGRIYIFIFVVATIAAWQLI